jgi:Bacterial protein of unknown function (DUF899)
VSSLNSDFNDFNTSVIEEQQRSGVVEYNYRGVETTWLQTDLATAGGVATMAAMTGTDVATYVGEAPSVSAFALEDGVVYHTYSAYSRPGRALGQCTSGSTVRRRGATRPTSGSRGGTSTTSCQCRAETRSSSLGRECRSRVIGRARLRSHRASDAAPSRSDGAWRDPGSIPGRLLDVHLGDESVTEGVDVDDASLRQHSSA